MVRKQHRQRPLRKHRPKDSSNGRQSKTEGMKRISLVPPPHVIVIPLNEEGEEEARDEQDGDLADSEVDESEEDMEEEKKQEERTIIDRGGGEEQEQEQEEQGQEQEQEQQQELQVEEGTEEKEEEEKRIDNGDADKKEGLGEEKKNEQHEQNVEMGKAGLESTMEASYDGEPYQETCKTRAVPRPPPLRILAISDTHGYEDQFFRDDKEKADGLPNADVLLHCGDFWPDDGRAVGCLDDFFVQYARHIPHIVVVRGNHDPYSRYVGETLFPRSGARYVTQSCRYDYDGVVFQLEPYGAKRHTVPYPGPCDVLASHEPPWGIRDRTSRGQAVGSDALRQTVEHSCHKPRLWLCGHIHEARGATWHCFQPPDETATPQWKSTRRRAPDDWDTNDDRQDYDRLDKDAIPSHPTLVANVANANPGRANRLSFGLVLFDVERTKGGPGWRAKPKPQRANTNEDSDDEENERENGNTTTARSALTVTNDDKNFSWLLSFLYRHVPLLGTLLAFFGFSFGNPATTTNQTTTETTTAEMLYDEEWIPNDENFTKKSIGSGRVSLPYKQKKNNKKKRKPRGRR